MNLPNLIFLNYFFIPVCQNGGECTNSEGSYSCSCPANWTGNNCEQDVDECANAFNSGIDLCSNDGKCMNTQGDFQCLCTMGWAGKTCDEDFDECAAALCPAGTVCKSAQQSFTCECPERGCNNLDEALYNEQLAQTYGFQSDSEVESSGQDELVEEVFEEEVSDSVDDLDNEENLEEDDSVDDYSEDVATESNDVATSEEMMVEDNDTNYEYVNIDDGESDETTENLK